MWSVSTRTTRWTVHQRKSHSWSLDMVAGSGRWPDNILPSSRPDRAEAILHAVNAIYPPSSHMWYLYQNKFDESKTRSHLNLIFVAWQCWEALFKSTSLKRSRFQALKLISLTLLVRSPLMWCWNRFWKQLFVCLYQDIIVVLVTPPKCTSRDTKYDSPRYMHVWYKLSIKPCYLNRNAWRCTLTESSIDPSEDIGSLLVFLQIVILTNGGIRAWSKLEFMHGRDKRWRVVSWIWGRCGYLNS